MSLQSLLPYVVSDAQHSLCLVQILQHISLTFCDAFDTLSVFSGKLSFLHWLNITRPILKLSHSKWTYFLLDQDVSLQTTSSGWRNVHWPFKITVTAMVSPLLPPSSTAWWKCYHAEEMCFCCCVGTWMLSASFTSKSSSPIQYHTGVQIFWFDKYYT